MDEQREIKDLRKSVRSLERRIELLKLTFAFATGAVLGAAAIAIAAERRALDAAVTELEKLRSD